MSSLFDSRHLMIFRLLARNHSFTQTAVNASVSQSAVSHTIQALERQVGCRLLDRSSRRVSLTPAGEQFLHHVDRILDEMSSAETGLKRLKNWGQTQLRVAAPASLCDNLLPRCLNEVRGSYPGCSIALESADRNASIELVLRGHVDIAVVTGSEPDERFEYHPLFCDELTFVMCPSHPWAQALPSLGSELGNEPIIAFPRGSYSWNLILHHLRPDRVEPTILIECNSVTAIRSMVLLGMGVGILARWVVAEDTRRGDLVCQPLGRRSLIRRWGTLSLRAKRLSLPQIQLIDEIRRCALSSLPGVTPAIPTPEPPDFRFPKSSPTEPMDASKSLEVGNPAFLPESTSMSTSPPTSSRPPHPSMR